MTVTGSIYIDDTLTHDGSWQFIQIMADSTAFETLNGTITWCAGGASTRSFSKGDFLMGNFRRIKLSSGKVLANTQATITA